MPEESRRSARGPSRGAAGRRLVAFGVALVVAGALLMHAPGPSALRLAPSIGSPPGGSGSANNFTVNLTDAPSFDPDHLAASAGSTVTLNLRNTGNFTHTFTLSKVGNLTLNQTWSPSQLDAFFATNGSFVNVSLAPHANGSATFVLPASANRTRLEFVSLEPYQFQAGMLGFLLVQATASGPAATVTEHTVDTLAFVPDVLAVNSTSFPVRVSVAVSNLGSVGHTWSLDPTPDNNLTPSGWGAYFGAHPPLANVTVPATAGVAVYANFTVNQRGVYEFICEVPGHFQAGMYGFLYVGVTPPAPPVPPSTAIVGVGILAGGAALLGVGVLFAVLAAYTGRFPPRAASHHH